MSDRLWNLVYLALCAAVLYMGFTVAAYNRHELLIRDACLRAGYVTMERVSGKHYCVKPDNGSTLMIRAPEIQE